MTAALLVAGLCAGLSLNHSAATVLLSNVRVAGAGDFVQSVNGQLYLHGMPFAFTGYDDYTLASTDPGFQCGGARSDASIDQELATMQQQSGSIVVRAWFFQSYGGPGNWSQFDRVLKLVAAHGMHIIPTLTNQWLDCEGLPSWMANTKYRPLSWWQSGYLQPDIPGRMSFRDFAVAMAQHYAGNSTIASWQLVNEGEAKTSANGACDNNAGGQAMRALDDNVGAAMRSVDPNHLLNLGTMGGGQCGTQGSMYGYVNGGAYNDLCEVHDYANAVIWGDQWNGEMPDVNACKALHKPLFAGEAGLDAAIQPNWSIGNSVTAQTLQTRASFFQQKLEALFRLGGVGYLIWGYTHNLGGSVSWEVGMGDPTQAMMLAEQQKINAKTMIGSLVVTDGDPNPGGGGAPGANVAALRSASLQRTNATTSAPTRASTPAPPTAHATTSREPVTLEVIPLSDWLLHRAR